MRGEHEGVTAVNRAPFRRAAQHAGPVHPVGDAERGGECPQRRAQSVGIGAGEDELVIRQVFCLTREGAQQQVAALLGVQAAKEE